MHVKHLQLLGVAGDLLRGRLGGGGTGHRGLGAHARPVGDRAGAVELVGPRVGPNRPSAPLTAVAGLRASPATAARAARTARAATPRRR